MAYMGDEASTRNGVQVLLSPGHQPDPSITTATGVSEWNS